MKSKKVTLSFDLAKKMYNSENAELRQLALDNFPELAPQKITDRIKTFEDCLNYANINEWEWKIGSSQLNKDEMAYRKLKMIASVLNEGWKPNWDKLNELKYYPIFSLAAQPINEFEDFAYHTVEASVFSLTHASSKLVYSSEELCEYAATQFKDIYKDFFLG